MYWLKITSLPNKNMLLFISFNNIDRVVLKIKHYQKIGMIYLKGVKMLPLLQTVYAAGVGGTTTPLCPIPV